MCFSHVKDMNYRGQKVDCCRKRKPERTNSTPAKQAGQASGRRQPLP